MAAFLIITLSSIGLPGLNGFVGEFLILLGAFQWNPRAAAFAATGVILSATYMLWMFQRVNYGPVSNEERAASGPFATRMDGAGSDCRHDRRDGCVPQHVSSTDGGIGQPDAEPGESRGVRADSGESEFTAHN